MQDKINFPPTWQADEDGLLAVGGHLSSKIIISAYKQGVFPWYSNEEPILWWTPNPRCVLLPEKLIISKSMRKFIRDTHLKCTVNTDFKLVIDNCSTITREGQSGTWITKGIKQAYINLHNIGQAHSVEVWNNDEIVGGLYGISIGMVFYGESMFSTQTNASKLAFIKLIKILQELKTPIIDCQIRTPHLVSLGAEEISRKEFEGHLKLNNKSADVLDWILIKALMEC